VYRSKKSSHLCDPKYGNGCIVFKIFSANNEAFIWLILKLCNFLLTVIEICLIILIKNIWLAEVFQIIEQLTVRGLAPSRNAGAGSYESIVSLGARGQTNGADV
jgi:type IV secretory pathway TrbL component